MRGTCRDQNANISFLIYGNDNKTTCNFSGYISTQQTPVRKFRCSVK